MSTTETGLDLDAIRALIDKANNTDRRDEVFTPDHDALIYHAELALAEVERLRGQVERFEHDLGEAWDDGNATGLDGWVGPGRGADYIDHEAVNARERFIRKALAEPEQEAEHKPCCVACKGTGHGAQELCWDCRGTGCAHP